MIYDNINNAERNEKFYRGFPEVFKKMREMAANTDEIDGRVTVGDYAYIDFTPHVKLRTGDQLFEYHQKYIDIHYVVKGKELIDYCISGNINTVNQNPDKDFFLAEGVPDATLILSPGTFAVFFAGEPHRPVMSSGNGDFVSKIVAKIKV